MASSCHKRCGTATPTQPHFFKIILDRVTDTIKLSIPMKFVKENGGSLKSKVNLQVPNGLIWEVDLLKRNREIWLDKGWQAFSDYHSLSYGDFVLFKYLGNSDFSVVIIDRSATEISYPIPDNAKESEIPIKKETDDDISVESSHSQSTPLKRKRSYSTENKMERKGHLEAGGFKSKNPVFICAMKPRHIQARNAALKIPLWFSRKFITKKTAQAMLNLPEKRSWKVKLDYTTLKGEKRVTLIDGWFAFVRDNCLGVGDICTFELIRGHEFAFTVSISWQAGGSSHPQSNNTGGRGMPSHKHSSNTATKKARKLTESEKNNALRKASSDFSSENPVFMIALQPSYVERNTLCVPRKFFEKHTKQCRHAMLEVGDRLWPVKLHANRGHGQLSFRTGWHVFARENSLEVGDVCVFELIDRDITLLKVFISRFGC